MKTFFKGITLFLVLITQSYASLLYVKGRCEKWGEPSLDIPQAKERMGWAKKCDKRLQQILSFDPDIFPDKRDIDGHERWMYPIYGTYDESGKAQNPKNWFAPRSREAACDGPNKFPEGYRIVGACFGGCFTPDQMIFFGEESLSIKKAKESRVSFVPTLSQDSTLENPIFTLKPVRDYITSIKAGDHAILNLTSISGKTLKVTQDHPLIDGQGRMRIAESFKVGEFLVNQFGGKEKIISIEKKNYFGKVYNIDIQSKDLSGKILVAQGFLTGDVSFQNEGTKYLNQVILRFNNIPDSLLK